MKALLMAVALLGLVASVSLAQVPPDPVLTTNTWSGTDTVGAYATFKASVSQFAQVTIVPPADFTIDSGAMGTRTETVAPTDPDALTGETLPSAGAAGAIDYETNCAVKSDIEVFEMNSGQGATWAVGAEPAFGERLFTQYKLGAMWDAMTLSTGGGEVWFRRYSNAAPLLDWTPAFDGNTVTPGDYGGTKLVADLDFDPTDCRYARIWWGVEATNKARDDNFDPGEPDEANYTKPALATDYRGLMIVTLHP